LDGLLSGANALPVDPSFASTSDAGGHVAVMFELGDALVAETGEDVLVVAAPQVVSNNAQSPVATAVARTRGLVIVRPVCNLTP
jgi:hypothetical protein